MTTPATFLGALVDALRQAGIYNRNDQVPPAAVLWPDKERQWEALAPLLREGLPLLTLGSYDPVQGIGPAYWLRCMIARTLPGDTLPEDATPIIYLPGISRQEIRAVEECPKTLQPLAELQYRGVLWTQRNGRDWTIAAFLQSRDGGLGIEVGADQATRAALQRALVRLADEPVARLRDEAPLRAPFFDGLLTPDEPRSLLLWLNDPEAYRQSVVSEEWAAFCAICKQKYGFDPTREEFVSVAESLGQRYGGWYQVWERYEEAPHSYPRIPELLRQAGPQQLSLFERSEVWPQSNEREESDLRKKLAALAQSASEEARVALYELEQRHGFRREWVWARVGKAPLAVALGSLVELAKATEHALGGITLESMVVAYADTGWRADAAVLGALAAVESLEDVNAVKAAVRAVYRPWLEATAHAFQQRVKAEAPDQHRFGAPVQTANGTCIIFSDALRYDVGQRLVSALGEQGYRCEIVPRLAALPPVTATAKPAISPVANLLTGQHSPGLTPTVAATASQLTAETLRKLLDDAGYQVLRDDNELGDPSGRAWTEMGAIDGYGHQHGWKVAHHVSGELHALQDRIEALLGHGWAQVIVVTDHGWLLLPGNLPKTNIPEHLTAVRKGRCARLKPLSKTDHQTVDWFWDDDVRIAVAPDICCYEASKEYEHGGLSPQECIVPVITVSAKA